MENKSKFKLFNFNKDSAGVEPGEDTTPNLKFFFKQFGRKFSKILSLNILTVFQVLPLIICLYLYFMASPTTPTLIYPEYSALFGIAEASSTAPSLLNLSVFSFQLGLPTYNTYVYWVIAVLLLFFVVTYGWIHFYLKDLARNQKEFQAGIFPRPYRLSYYVCVGI